MTEKDLGQAPWDICKLFDDIDDSTRCGEHLYETF